MGTVSSASILCMSISCLVGFGLPVGMLIFFRRKKADLLPFFVGCGVMLFFALVLESAVHGIVLSSPVGQVIQSSLLLYALYGGLMAGLFEETGRLVAFRTLLRKNQGKDINAWMYGAGHGGFESAALLGLGMVNNLVYSAMINSGSAENVLAALTDQARAQTEAALQSLISASPALFLAGSVERIFAVILQLSLSVLVWFAVKKKGQAKLYPIAILIHFAVDAVVVVLSGLGLPIVLTEAIIGVMAAASLWYALRVWRAQREPAAL